MRSRERVTENAREQIRDAVQASAAQAFQSNNTTFLNLAQEQLNTTMEAAKGEFNQRHEQFQAPVKPLTEDFDDNPNGEKADQEIRAMRFAIDMTKPGRNDLEEMETAHFMLSRQVSEERTESLTGYQRAQI